MSCAHSLYCLDTMEYHPAETVPDPARSGKTMDIPSFTSWTGGLGCMPSDPNSPGHCLKLLGGKGTGGKDQYMKGLKMMECSVLTRFCHLPVSSYLQGTSDLELRSVR